MLSSDGGDSTGTVPKSIYEGRGNDTTGTTGGKRISLGPVLVGYWNNIMLRTEVKFPVYESVWGTQVGRGIDFNVRLGVTF